jgi:hypothetical protein
MVDGTSFDAVIAKCDVRPLVLKFAIGLAKDTVVAQVYT